MPPSQPTPSHTTSGLSRAYGSGSPAGPSQQGGPSAPGQAPPYSAPYGTSYPGAPTQGGPAPQYAPYGYGAPAPVVQRTNGKAVAAFVLSLVGFFLIPLIPSIIAVILGHSARSEINKNPNQTGGGLAVAGLVIAWITIGIFVLVGLFFLIMFTMIFGSF